MKTSINLTIVTIVLFTLFFSITSGKPRQNASIIPDMEIVERSLEMENWMVDENNWQVDEFMSFVEEESLYLDNWMTDKDLWESKNSFSTIEEEEPALILEDWITDPYNWLK